MERSLLLDPNLDLPRRWGDLVTNQPRLSGERLAEATAVHTLDDLIHSGSTLAAAVETLRGAGLSVETAAAFLGSPPDTIADAVADIGVRLTVFVTTR